MTTQFLTLAEAKAILRVGQRVFVWIPVDVTGEDDQGDELAFTTEAGALAQITGIDTFGAPQGFAVTVDFIDDRGGYATFDEADRYLVSPTTPLYPFSLAGCLAEPPTLAEQVAAFITAYDAALNDEDRDGGPIAPNGDDYNALADGVNVILAGQGAPAIKLSHHGR